MPEIILPEWGEATPPDPLSPSESPISPGIALPKWEGGEIVQYGDTVPADVLRQDPLLAKTLRAVSVPLSVGTSVPFGLYNAARTGDISRLWDSIKGGEGWSENLPLEQYLGNWGIGIELALDVIVDPLNLLTFGMAGLAGKLPKVVLKSNSALRGLKTLGIADDVATMSPKAVREVVRHTRRHADDLAIRFPDMSRKKVAELANDSARKNVEYLVNEDALRLARGEAQEGYIYKGGIQFGAPVPTFGAGWIAKKIMTGGQKVPYGIDDLVRTNWDWSAKLGQTTIGKRIPQIGLAAVGGRLVGEFAGELPGWLTAAGIGAIGEVWRRPKMKAKVIEAGKRAAKRPKWLTDLSESVKARVPEWAMDTRVLGRIRTGIKDVDELIKSYDGQYFYHRGKWVQIGQQLRDAVDSDIKEMAEKFGPLTKPEMGELRQTYWDNLVSELDSPLGSDELIRRDYDLVKASEQQQQRRLNQQRQALGVSESADSVHTMLRKETDTKIENISQQLASDTLDGNIQADLVRQRQALQQRLGLERLAETEGGQEYRELLNDVENLQSQYNDIHDTVIQFERKALGMDDDTISPDLVSAQAAQTFQEAPSLIENLDVPSELYTPSLDRLKTHIDELPDDQFMKLLRNDEVQELTYKGQTATPEGMYPLVRSLRRAYLQMAHGELESGQPLRTLNNYVPHVLRQPVLEYIRKRQPEILEGRAVNPKSFNTLARNIKLTIKEMNNATDAASQGKSIDMSLPEGGTQTLYTVAQYIAHADISDCIRFVNREMAGLAAGIGLDEEGNPTYNPWLGLAGMGIMYTRKSRYEPQALLKIAQRGRDFAKFPVSDTSKGAIRWAMGMLEGFDDGLNYERASQVADNLVRGGVGMMDLPDNYYEAAPKVFSLHSQNLEDYANALQGWVDVNANQLRRIEGVEPVWVRPAEEAHPASGAVPLGAPRAGLEEHEAPPAPREAQPVKDKFDQAIADLHAMAKRKPVNLKPLTGVPESPLTARYRKLFALRQQGQSVAVIRMNSYLDAKDFIDEAADDARYLVDTGHDPTAIVNSMESFVNHPPNRTKLESLSTQKYGTYAAEATPEQYAQAQSQFIDLAARESAFQYASDALRTIRGYVNTHAPQVSRRGQMVRIPVKSVEGVGAGRIPDEDMLLDTGQIASVGIAENMLAEDLRHLGVTDLDIPGPVQAKPLIKVISGGQTGADRAGIQSAKDAGLQTGGYAATGFKTEEGADLSLANYDLIDRTETGEALNYQQRTQRNIDNSDGTVVFLPYGTESASVGSHKTIGYAQTGKWRNGELKSVDDGHKPVLVIRDVSSKNADERADFIYQFIVRNGIGTLNVAGPRSSVSPGIERAVSDIMTRAYGKSKTFQEMRRGTEVQEPGLPGQIRRETESFTERMAQSQRDYPRVTTPKVPTQAVLPPVAAAAALDQEDSDGQPAWYKRPEILIPAIVAGIAGGTVGYKQLRKYLDDTKDMTLAATVKIAKDIEDIQALPEGQARLGLPAPSEAIPLSTSAPSGPPIEMTGRITDENINRIRDIDAELERVQREIHSSMYSSVDPDTSALNRLEAHRSDLELERREILGQEMRPRGSLTPEESARYNELLEDAQINDEYIFFTRDEIAQLPDNDPSLPELQRQLAEYEALGDEFWSLNDRLLQFNPTEAYERGEAFYHGMGAYADVFTDMELPVVSAIQRLLASALGDVNLRVGQANVKPQLAAYTSAPDAGMATRHRSGHLSPIRLLIVPDAADIKHAAPGDTVSGMEGMERTTSRASTSVGEAIDNRSVNSISSAMHNEFNVELKPGNFRIVIDDTPHSRRGSPNLPTPEEKEYIDALNVVLDQFIVDRVSGKEVPESFELMLRSAGIGDITTDIQSIAESLIEVYPALTPTQAHKYSELMSKQGDLSRQLGIKDISNRFAFPNSHIFHFQLFPIGSLMRIVQQWSEDAMQAASKLKDPAQVKASEYLELYGNIRADIRGSVKDLVEQLKTRDVSGEAAERPAMLRRILGYAGMEDETVRARLSDRGITPAQMRSVGIGSAAAAAAAQEDDDSPGRLDILDIGLIALAATAGRGIPHKLTRDQARALKNISDALRSGDADMQRAALNGIRQLNEAGKLLNYEHTDPAAIVEAVHGIRDMLRPAGTDRLTDEGAELIGAAEIETDIGHQAIELFQALTGNTDEAKAFVNETYLHHPNLRVSDEPIPVVDVEPEQPIITPQQAARRVRVNQPIGPEGITIGSQRVRLSEQYDPTEANRLIVALNKERAAAAAGKPYQGSYDPRISDYLATHRVAISNGLINGQLGAKSNRNFYNGMRDLSNQFEPGGALEGGKFFSDDPAFISTVRGLKHTKAVTSGELLADAAKLWGKPLNEVTGDTLLNHSPQWVRTDLSGLSAAKTPYARKLYQVARGMWPDYAHARGEDFIMKRRELEGRIESSAGVIEKIEAKIEEVASGADPEPLKVARIRGLRTAIGNIQEAVSDTSQMLGQFSPPGWRTLDRMNVLQADGTRVPHHALYGRHGDPLYFPEKIADALEHATRKYNDEGEVGKLLGMYDKTLTFIKAWTLLPFAAYHFRNLADGIWRSWVAGNEDINNYKDAVAIRHGKDPSSIQVAGYNGSQIADLAEKRGAVGTGFVESELVQDANDFAVGDISTAQALGSRSITRRAVPTLAGAGVGFAATEGDIEQRLQGAAVGGVAGTVLGSKIPLKLGGQVASEIEDTMRLSHFINQIRKGDTPAAAAAATKRVHIDYHDLSPWEQKVMKRVFPFFTFHSRNIPLQLAMKAQQPSRYNIPYTLADWANTHNVIPALSGGDAPPNEEYMARWMSEAHPIRVKVNPDGSANYFLLGHWMSDESLSKTFAEDGVTSTASRVSDMATDLLSPILRAPVEWFLNYDMFRKQAIDRSLKQPLPGDPTYTPPNRQVGIPPVSPSVGAGREPADYLGLPMKRKVMAVLDEMRLLSEANRMNPGHIFGKRPEHRRGKRIEEGKAPFMQETSMERTNIPFHRRYDADTTTRSLYYLVGRGLHRYDPAQGQYYRLAELKTRGNVPFYVKNIAQVDDLSSHEPMFRDHFKSRALVASDRAQAYAKRARYLRRIGDTRGADAFIQTAREYAAAAAAK